MKTEEEKEPYCYYYQFYIGRNKIADCTIEYSQSGAIKKLRDKWSPLGYATNFDLLEGDEIPAHLDERANSLKV